MAKAVLILVRTQSGKKCTLSLVNLFLMAFKIIIRNISTMTRIFAIPTALIFCYKSS